MRIGIDWGGTKIEIAALDDEGEEIFRKRIATPRNDYHGCLDAVAHLVSEAENCFASTASVGIGIPGTISPASGLVKNANSTWLNGQPLKQDIEAVLKREVRIENDANCFAVSEAVDGAGAGANLVVGVILGTGCGSGIAIDGKAYRGRNAIGGEFGHITLAWLEEEEFPGRRCWCGQNGCLETWISGTAFQLDYQLRSGEKRMREGSEILALDNAASRSAYSAYCSRLARGLATLVNILDPDVLVLGGGMSKVEALYRDVPPLMGRYVFSDQFDTPIVPASHGDASGVRGAAWLW